MKRILILVAVLMVASVAWGQEFDWYEYVESLRRMQRELENLRDVMAELTNKNFEASVDFVANVDAQSATNNLTRAGAVFESGVAISNVHKTVSVVTNVVERDNGVPVNNPFDARFYFGDGTPLNLQAVPATKKTETTTITRITVYTFWLDGKQERIERREVLSETVRRWKKSEQCVEAPPRQEDE